MRRSDEPGGTARACTHKQAQNSVSYSGQFYRALVFAAEKRVCEFLKGVSAPATHAFIFAGAAGLLVRIFFELRVLLPGHIDLVRPTFRGVGAGPAAFPTSVRHVLVLSCAVAGGLWCRRIVGDV